ncbi:MAG: DUF4190 domain-containing protein [Aeromicrobium sp.]|uniref:DUF4190 domain-containing protein n=1 Tax=Aeromicrobium sp. TaxID=1871063 RepID=UPI0039E6BB6C
MSHQDPNIASGLPSYGSTTPPPGTYPSAAPGGYGMPPRNNPKAIWALVLGLVAFFCCGFITGIPAIILGLLAKKDIEASQGTQTGKGMAIAGLVLGILAVLFNILMGILYATGALTLEFSTY